MDYFSRLLVTCVFFIAFKLPSVHLTFGFDKSRFFLDKYPTLEESLDAINIDSKKTHKLIRTPFIIHGSLNDRVKVVNNGKSVEVILDQPSSATSVTGGILGTDVYEFKKIIYYWTNDPNGVAATTIDGKGTPLVDVAVFFNRKYKTFENALKHDDGIVQVHFLLKICLSGPNKLFNNYAKILKQILPAGSSKETVFSTTVGWFASNIPIINVYYAYEGSVIDEQTGKRSRSIVVVISHLAQRCLSTEQFEETFGSFKNLMGKSLTNKKQPFSQTVPVAQLEGILNYNTA